MIDSFKRVLAGSFRRQKQHIEQVITNAALGTVIETDKLVAYLDHAIEVFNSHADEIDRKFGKGWFGVRLVRENAHTYRIEGDRTLAMVKLEYLQATDPQPVYDLMHDLLFMSSIPEKQLKRQATARDGFWNRVLRKRKLAIRLWNEKKAQERKEAVAERIAEVEKRDYRKHLEEFSRAIGGIVPAGWPLSWRAGVPAPRIRGRGRKVSAPSMKAQEEENAHLKPFARMRANRAATVRFKGHMKDDHADLNKFKAADTLAKKKEEEANVPTKPLPRTKR